MCFLGEIHTMFPQLANKPSKILPADMVTDHVLKNQRLTVLTKIKKAKLKVGRFLFILVIHKVIDFMSLVSIWLAFSFKQFPP